MSVSTEWSTKKQTAKMISRTERTVSQVVRDAVDKRSDDILANLKLVYANGVEVPGPEVTVELLAKNEQVGSRTRWFFRRAWWRDEFALRINDSSYVDTEPASDEAGQVEPAQKRGVADELLGDRPALPSDPSVRAIVLEHLHYSDRKHATEIKQLTDRVLQVVETNQQLQGQTNTLYNQFQDALKQSGGLKALIEGSAVSDAERPLQQPPATSPGTETNVIEVQPQVREGESARPRAAKRPKPKAKSIAPRSAEPKDAFPTFRQLARFLRGK